MKNLPRILQIIWMLVAAVCIFQAYDILSAQEVQDKTSGYLFIGVSLFATMRYVMLRRRQFLDKKKDGKFG
jgi:hypothetical protein